MKNFIKIIACSVIGLSIFCLAGCGETPPPDQPTVTISSGEILNVNTTFYVDDTISTDNILLELTMSDGTTKQVNVTSDMLSLPDMSTPGNKYIIVNYDGKQYSIAVEVKDKPELLKKLAQFLENYKTAGNIESITVSGVANLKTTYLNEEKPLDQSSFTENLTREQALEIDSLLEVVYDSISKGVFEGGLDIGVNDILDSEQLKSTFDLVRSLTKIYENFKSFDLRTILFDKCFPQGTSAFVDNIVEQSNTVLSLNLKGRANLNTLITTLLNDIKQGKDVNAVAVIKNLNNIIQENSSCEQAILDLIQQATDIASNESTGKHCISTFANFILSQTNGNVVHTQLDAATQEQIDLAEQLSAEYNQELVALIKAFEDYDETNKAQSNEKLIAQVNSMIAFVEKVKTSECFIQNSPFSAFLAERIWEDGNIRYEFTDYSINKQVLEIVIAYINGNTQNMEQNQTIETILGIYTNMPDEYKTIVSQIIYDIASGEQITTNTFEDLIVKLGEMTEISEAEVDAYIEDLNKNGYCTVLSDMFEKYREVFFENMQDLDNQTANQIFDNLKACIMEIEKAPIGCNFEKALYHYIKAVDTAANNLNVSQYVQVITSLLNISKNGDSYTFDIEQNLYETFNLISSLLDEYKAQVVENSGKEEKIEKFFDIYKSLIYVDYDINSNKYSLNYKQNIINSISAINEFMQVYEYYGNDVELMEMVKNALLSLSTVENNKIDVEGNLENAFHDIIDYAIVNKRAISLGIASLLEIDQNNTSALYSLDSWVNNLLVSIKYDEVDIETIVKNLCTIANTYGTEQGSNIAACLSVLTAVYFGDENQSYNEMFKDLPLPDGISVDYDKLFEKLSDNKTYDIVEISDLTIDYVTNAQGELVKQILNFEISVNLDASIPATEAMDDFVVASIFGTINFSLELNI